MAPSIVILFSMFRVRAHHLFSREKLMSAIIVWKQKNVWWIRGLNGNEGLVRSEQKICLAFKCFRLDWTSSSNSVCAGVCCFHGNCWSFLDEIW